MTKLLEDAKEAGFYVSDEGFIFSFDGFNINSQLARFAALKQSQWICCNVEKPLKKQRVIGYGIEQAFWAGAEVNTEYSIEIGDWTGKSISIDDYIDLVKVTHWMPLPSPPINTEVT